MNNREPKRPPIDIKELKKREGEDPKKGEITYLEKNRGRGGGTKSKVNLTQLVLAVGLSILVFVLISNFWLTPKKDALVLLENQKLLETQQAGLEGGLDAESNRIDNIISTYATKGELDAVESQIQGFATQSTLDSLKSLVLGQGDDIETLEGRVSSLEASINETVSVGGGSLDYWIEYKSGEPYLHATSIREGVFDIRLTLVPSNPYGLVGEGFNAACKDFYTLFGTRYIPVIIWEDSVWKVSEVSINYGTRHLEKGVEKKGYLDNLPDLPGGFGNYDIFVELLTGTSEPDSVGGDSF